jgi:hypothetical protein
MKHTHTPLYTVLIGALTCAGFPLASAQTDSKPIVITPPAVQNGSNWSRAPFPAERRFDDVKPADGKAIDDLPPNTPATNTEPPVPPARVAIMQSTTPGISDPALAPTGRVSATTYNSGATTTTTYASAPGYAVAQSSSSKPVVITPPAVQNGSNWSRAPFPAERRFDDVKPADGQAIDNLPPNTPATNTEPPVPAARVAIMQSTTPGISDPALAPTGRVAATTTTTSYDTAPRAYAVAQVRDGSKPVVITPPAVQNGSNWSRAPFPAERRFDDVKPADGQAIDNLPPNTPATNIEPPVPEARVAVLQGPSTPAPTAVADATLLPTGRVAVATSFDAATVTPTIRTATVANRNQVIADIESRITASESAVGSMRNTASQMGTEARRQFNAASDDVKEKAKALRKSLAAAKKATDQEWESAKAQLASDFEAYGAALGRIDSAAVAR